jgi:hypothetical protein
MGEVSGIADRRSAGPQDHVENVKVGQANFRYQAWVLKELMRVAI